MNRFPTLLTAIFCAALAFAPFGHAATTKKKSSTKKSTSTTKKPTTLDKKPAEGESSATKKAGASTPLDLPLPTKPESSGTESSPPPKKTAETPAPESKPAAEPATAKQEHAPNATVEPDDITEFATQPPRVQQMIRDALELTRLNLTYAYGSDDPNSGGMDCSGTIRYLLAAHGLTGVPRDSSGQYLWARKSGAFFPVVSKNADSVEFAELLPGDLMFWTGTYDTQKDVPISHVMLYLGREKVGGKRIMFGASDGRSYHGVQRWGVSVFDFNMPKSNPEKPDKAVPDFVGFARIPGARTGVVGGERAAVETTATVDAKPKAVSGETKATPSSSKPKTSSKKKKKS